MNDEGLACTGNDCGSQRRRVDHIHRVGVAENENGVHVVDCDKVGAGDCFGKEVELRCHYLHQETEA